MAQLIGGGDSVENCKNDIKKPHSKISSHISPASPVTSLCHTSDEENSGEWNYVQDDTERWGDFGDSFVFSERTFSAFSTFPWVVLTTTESGLLRHHAQNLLSKDPRDAEESCHALLDVLLHDFPPEIFLQRPAVIQGLFELLESKTSTLFIPAFDCLTELTEKLSVRFYQSSTCIVDGRSGQRGDGDCSLSVPHARTDSYAYSRSSITSVKSSRSASPTASKNGRISSPDSSGWGSEFAEMESPEETLKLQLRQIPFPVYLCATVDVCLNMLTDELPLGISTPLHLLDLSTRLLRSTIPPSIWTEDPTNPATSMDPANPTNPATSTDLRDPVTSVNSTEGRMVAENLLHSLQAAGNRTLYHHHHSERKKSSRLIYTALCKVILTLTDLLPVRHSQHSQHSDIIPDAFRACLPLICQDEAVALAYPLIRRRLLPHLKASHPSGYALFKEAQEVCAAMSATCQFIQNVTEAPSRTYTDAPPRTYVDVSSCTYTDAPSRTYEEGSACTYAEQAIQALPSLVYHQSSLFIQKCFQLCSDALGRTPEPTNPLRKLSTKLIIDLISYPNVTVQKEVYETLWHFCGRRLNVERAADAKETPGRRVLFLLSKEVLREIVFYGMFQSETRMFAQKILSLFSLKFLFNNETVWDRLRSAIRTMFCAVFIHADLDSDFGRRVISWSQEGEEENSLFDERTKRRAAFSLMFHHNRLVRGHAAQLLLSRMKEMRLHGDTFMPEVQYVFEVNEVDTSETFSEERMERSLKVFCDTRVGVAVRWAALKHIHAQLKGSLSQESFVKMKGPQSLLSMLRVVVEGVEKECSVENLILLLDSLLCVVYYNDKWRLENSEDMKLYECVVSALSLVHNGSVQWDRVQCIAASIIFLLSFADVLLRTDQSLSICCTFYRSVLFPINIMFHDFNKKTTKTTKNKKTEKNTKTEKNEKYTKNIKNQKNEKNTENLKNEKTIKNVKNTKSVNCDLLRSPVASMLVLHWNICLAGNFDCFFSSKTKNDFETEFDFAPRLSMDDSAKNLVKITHPKYGFLRACQGLQCAKSHRDAAEFLDEMSVFLILWPFLKGEELEGIPSGVESFFRYVSVLPHNSQDLNLLRKIAKFVFLAAQRYTAMGRCGPASHWMNCLLFDKGSLFFDAVHKSNKDVTLLSPCRSSFRVEYISTNKSFSTTAWRLIHSLPQMIDSQGGEGGKGSEGVDVVEILHLFVETVRNALMQPCVDFATLGTVCRCIAEYCGLASVAKQPETISLVPLLITTLQVTHQSNQDTTSSFTHRSIIQSASLALLTLITHQLENNLFPAILECWKDPFVPSVPSPMPESWKDPSAPSAPSAPSCLTWLLPLLAHRDPTVRSAGLSIATTLCHTKEGRALVVDVFTFIPGGVWNAALSFLFSADETDLVKYTAVNLLSVLLRSELNRTELTLSDRHTNSQTDRQRGSQTDRSCAKGVDVTETEALCSMLEGVGFYHALLQICRDFDGTRRPPPPTEHPLGGTRSTRIPTEYLLGAVFSLCATLIRVTGKRTVVRLKEMKFFHSAVHVGFLVKVFVQESPRLLDRLDMFRDLFALLAQAVQTDETIAEIVFYNMHVVSAALCLLDTTIAPFEEMRHLWTNIYICLMECLQNRLLLHHVWRLFMEHHYTLYTNIQTCLTLVTTNLENNPQGTQGTHSSEGTHGSEGTEGGEGRRLQVALLSMMEVVTEVDGSEVEEFLWRTVAGVSVSSDKAQCFDDKAQFFGDKPKCVGFLLTDFLVRKFGEPSALQFDVWTVLLNRFLLRYETVRSVAMEGAVLETVIDLLLEMDTSITRHIPLYTRKIIKQKLTAPLRMSMEVLINLLFKNVKNKQVAAQKSLVSVLISLWISIVHDTECLHILFFKLLCTYSAHCQDALTTFVQESEDHHTAPLTVFHIIMTDLEEQLALPLPHPDITPLLFDIIAQMSLNPLCRVFLRKNINIKKSMPILNKKPQKTQKTQKTQNTQKTQKMQKTVQRTKNIDAMWLHVLCNLSFFEDGQVFLLSKEDICTVLFEYLEIEGLFVEIYISSMFILRNLSFCKKGMARLTGAKGVLARLVRLSSTHSQPKVRLYALSCLLELLYDQVKLRHAAKAITFDELGRGRADDEPQMFDLRRRLVACLDGDSPPPVHHDPYDQLA